MMKFRGETPDGPIYGFGLSRANLIFLSAGRPIKLNLADLGGPPIPIVLMFGETEAALYDELKAAGLIPIDMPYTPAKPGVTEVVRDRRPGGKEDDHK